MRSILVATVITLLVVAPALAGVRAPGRDGPCDRTSVVLSPAPVGCQYRFLADGSLDVLSVLVTLRDCFDVPVANCSLDVTLSPNAGTLAFCACGTPQLGGITDPNGVLEVQFSRIGGRGRIDVEVTARCGGGDIAISEDEIAFTTPDQNGSCESEQSMTIHDVGLFAASWPPNGQYSETADFDCNGTIDVIDVGLVSLGWSPAMGCGD